MFKIHEIVFYHAITNILLAVIGLPLVFLVYYVVKLVVASLSSPLRDLQGPPGGRFLSGHMFKMTGGQCYDTLVGWRKQYGHVFAIRAALGVSHNSSYPFLNYINSLYLLHLGFVVISNVDW
jgi:hypothetical protein